MFYLSTDKILNIFYECKDKELIFLPMHGQGTQYYLPVHEQRPQYVLPGHGQKTQYFLQTKNTIFLLVH
jgi:hypothetical protein